MARAGLICASGLRLGGILLAAIVGMAVPAVAPAFAQENTQENAEVNPPAITGNTATTGINTQTTRFAPAAPEAPQSVILTIESDALYTRSAYGRRVEAEIEADSAVLAAENRRIEAELGAEEQSLTDRRASMEPTAFRALADAFDEKVQANRQAQQAKLQELTQRRESARTELILAARPILEAMMLEAGANVILERGTVFLSANATDITDLAVSRIDAAIGDGAPAAQGEE